MVGNGHHGMSFDVTDFIMNLENGLHMENGIGNGHFIIMAGQDN